MKHKKLKPSRIILIIPTVTIFSLIAVFGISLFTGNTDQSNIGTSQASAAQPADINSDNKVDVFDLSILLSKWNTTDTLSDINKDGTVNVFDLSMLLSKWGAVTSVSIGVYGTSYNMDGVGNLQIGGMSSGQPNSYVSIRFRADVSGTLNTIRTYWVGAQFPGYGGGNGGTIRITVQADNNGLPSGTILASFDHAPGPVSQTFPLLTFASPTTLNSGTLYHLVFTNIDPSPTVNFSSINGTYMSTTVNPRQPNRSDSDYAIVTKYGSGSWAVNSRHTPIIDLTYGSGAHQGQGYMEVEIAAQPLITGSTNYMRERFTVSGGNRTITGGAVRVAKTVGVGDLTIRLEDASGTLIDSFSVPAISVPLLSTNYNSSGVWVSGTFSSALTLNNGSTYYLRLSTDSSTTYWSRGIQQGGNAYGFGAATYFNDGYLQYTTNGGTSWSTVPGLETDGDLQFYLQ